MRMKDYLLDTFRYNDHANKMALVKIREIPEKDECIRFFCHMINSMNKWLGRIRQCPGYTELDWWKPEYPLDEMELKWDECLQAWIEFIEGKTEEELFEEVEFIGFDGHDFAAVIKDIALQLNYHAIQHRSQIQYLIRQQGVTPDFVDYIGTKYRKLS
jgi:uncharacterized damage-inducible protein DinB